MLFVRIERNLKSYQYKKKPKAPDDWDNNKNNSCLDTLYLYEYESLLFQAKCQTVANIPNGNFKDTITTGPFLIKCFVEKRNFYCDVHGICQTATLANDWITDDCTTDKNELRWLIHDNTKVAPNPPGVETSIPWSSGCLVLRKTDFEAFNEIIKAFGYKAGDTIDAELLNKGE